MMSIRQSADVRRSSVLDAAIVEFGRSGYAGTSTEAIATRAGISQPYLFRLFGTKKELFIDTYRLVISRIESAFSEAADGLEGEEAMLAMGTAYLELSGDPDLLHTQLHAFAAAAADPDIAAACQDSFRRLWHLVTDATGADPDTLREFFAHGMLCSVIAAINLGSVDEPWAKALFNVDETKRRAMLAMGTKTTPADAGVA